MSDAITAAYRKENEYICLIDVLIKDWYIYLEAAREEKRLPIIYDSNKSKGFVFDATSLTAKANKKGIELVVITAEAGKIITAPINEFYVLKNQFYQIVTRFINQAEKDQL